MQTNLHLTTRHQWHAKRKSEKMEWRTNWHQRSATDVTLRIQTAKDHFVATLCGAPNTFPLHLWYRLLPQTEQTFNMLQKSNTTPKISAYTHIHGIHNYMKNPIAPLGVNVQAYKMPANRGIWATHTVDGWNLGTSMEHHRSFKIYIKKTQHKRIVETVHFKHKHFTKPFPIIDNCIVMTAQQLTIALTNNQTQENSTKKRSKR